MKQGKKTKRKKQVEIAFGWRNNVFIIDSSGKVIEHPEFYTSCLKDLAKKNQRCSRRLRWECMDCKKINPKYKTEKRRKKCIDCGSENIRKYCSKNWHKAKYTLSKYHEHLANKRSYWIWSLVRFYADNYDTVIINKWPLKYAIEYAVENKTARKLCDGAYGLFVQRLKFKCKELGTEFIERKDLVWQEEMDRLMRVAETEHLRKMIRQTRIAIKWPNPKRLQFLKEDSKRRVI